MKDWYKKWIKPELKDAGSEFKQVLHNITRLTGVENQAGLLIDFGSAPSSAVFEFFEILSNNEVKKVVIKSSNKYK